MYIQSSHPHWICFQPNFLNMWLSDYFSLHPSCCSLGLVLDVVSNSFPYVNINIVMVTMVARILALMSSG